MQTFLPYPDFKESAECLDYKRLGKQRVEARQILNVLLGLTKPNKNGNVAWANHPAVKMWRGYENTLKLYFNTVSEEWIKRGYRHNIGFYDIDRKEIVYPQWINVDRFHASHRSNLLRKNFEFYQQYNWSEPANLPYIWPIN